MIDIDNFKFINDALGHGTGDALIARVGSAIHGRLRATDTLARLGGDEFAAVLPDTTLEEAELVAEGLLRSVSDDSGVTELAGRRHVSLSVGVAPFSDSDGFEAEKLLVNADIALYDAKEAGRGGWHHYNPSENSHTQMELRLSRADMIHDALRESRFSRRAADPRSQDDAPIPLGAARPDGRDRRRVDPTDVVPRHRGALRRDADDRQVGLQRASVLIADEQRPAARCASPSTSRQLARGRLAFAVHPRRAARRGSRPARLLRRADGHRLEHRRRGRAELRLRDQGGRLRGRPRRLRCRLELALPAEAPHLRLAQDRPRVRARPAHERGQSTDRRGDRRCCKRARKADLREVRRASGGARASTRARCRLRSGLPHRPTRGHRAARRVAPPYVRLRPLGTCR